MRTATLSDICIADAVHAVASGLEPAFDAATGKPRVRFGDRKVFIAALWQALALEWHVELSSLGLESLADFKSWLLSAMLTADSLGRPLVLLARADLVGAMYHPAVMTSEIADRGATFHFVIDRVTGAEDYARSAQRPLTADDTRPMRRY